MLKRRYVTAGLESPCEFRRRKLSSKLIRITRISRNPCDLSKVLPWRLDHTVREPSLMK